MNKNTTPYQWQGEPVTVEFGRSIVHENKEKPLFWYNYECNSEPPKGTACIPSIKVTTKDGSSFVIANHFGIGVYKLLSGGWPSHTHFSVGEDFTEDKDFSITEFDKSCYVAYEAGRTAWQKKNFPEEYERMDALRRLATRSSWQQMPCKIVPKEK